MYLGVVEGRWIWGRVATSLTAFSAFILSVPRSVYFSNTDNTSLDLTNMNNLSNFEMDQVYSVLWRLKSVTTITTTCTIMSRK